MEKNPLIKENWSSNFTLIGTPKIGDFTYKIDARSEKSDWVYNSMNLGIDCGEKCGVVYSDCMGGYAEQRDSIIYAHGKNEDGTDDFKKKIEVAWEDRNDDSVLSEIGEMCFITVGLQKTDKGKTFYKKFLSAYDAIVYVKDHLTEDMVVNVKGNINYSIYNGNTQIRKTIKSIVLSSVDDPSKYRATFTQTLLLDKDSVGQQNIDKDKGVMYVDARVLDYVKEYNGVEVKGNFPYSVQFEFPMDFTNQEQCKKILDKVFKVKKGITQITFEGEFIESGAAVMATWEDVPDDIKDLVACGIYTEEEVLEKCSANGNKEKKMVLKKPFIKLVGDDDKKVAVMQKFEEKFNEEDLILDCMIEKNEDEDLDIPLDEDMGNEDDGMSWLEGLE